MKRILLTTLALSFLAPAAAFAYGYKVCNGKKIKWTDETALLRHSAVGFPNGSNTRTASADTIDKLNENPSQMRFTRSWDDGSVWTGNGQNEVWFTDKDIGAPARTVFRYRGLAGCSNPRLHETDIQFSTGESYTTSTTLSNLWRYGGAYRPFRTTLMHELGHAAGLAHENRRYNIMGDDWTHIHANNGKARAYLGEDAANGLVFLYGTVAGAYEDLSVSHWEYKGTDGEYSDHKRCGMRDQNGNLLEEYSTSNDIVRKVHRGQTIQVEFTYENNGKSSHNVDIGFYLSVNHNITNGDTRIGGWNDTLDRDVVKTATRTVTIPAGAALGDAWLGVIIDESDAVVEFTEDNNATYAHIYILP